MVIRQNDDLIIDKFIWDRPLVRFSSRKAWVDLSKCVSSIMFMDNDLGLCYKVKISTGSESYVNPRYMIKRPAGARMVIYSTSDVPSGFRSSQINEIVKLLRIWSHPLNDAWNKFYDMKGAISAYGWNPEMKYEPIVSNGDIKYQYLNELVTPHELCYNLLMNYMTTKFNDIPKQHLREIERKFHLGSSLKTLTLDENPQK